MEKKRIWIKANGNGIIATGHIRRCMTIAKELMDRGAEVMFVLADTDSADLLITLSKEDGVEFCCTWSTRTNRTLGTVRRTTTQLHCLLRRVRLLRCICASSGKSVTYNSQ